MDYDVSIVTVSLNSVSTIEDTIKSVIKQKKENIEYILVDGMSTDGTIDIINRYRDFIDQIIIEHDNGISDAFNKGIKISHGKIIGIINADDLLCNGALDALINNISEDIDIYRGQVYKWNSENNEKKLIIPSMNLIPHGQKIVVAHPGTFISRKAYEKWGVYDEHCKFKMDLDLLMRFSIAGAKMKYLPYPLAFFRIGGVSTETHPTYKQIKKTTNETYYVYRKNNRNLIITIYSCFKVFIKAYLRRF